MNGDTGKTSRSFTDYQWCEQATMFVLIHVVRKGATEAFSASGHCILFPAVVMELLDRVFVTNHDWYPHYLRELVTEDFYKFKEHWQSGLPLDMELLTVETCPDAQYCPVTEDISVDDNTLCQAVEAIEHQ